MANLDASPREVNCVLHPEKLPHPLNSVTSAKLVAGSALSGKGDWQDAPSLDARRLLGEGIKISIPGDDAILIQVR